MTVRTEILFDRLDVDDVDAIVAKYQSECGLPISPRVARYLSASDRDQDLFCEVSQSVLFNLVSELQSDRSEAGAVDLIALLSIVSGFETGGLQDSLLRAALAALMNARAGVGVSVS